jgi:hypothetical protein
MFETSTEIEPDPAIEAYKKDIDRTLIRENLRLTVEQRFENLERLQKFAEELRRAGREQEIKNLNTAIFREGG